MNSLLFRGIFFLSGAVACSSMTGSCLADQDSSDPVIATSGTFSFRLSNGKEITGYTTDDASAKMILAGTELKVPLSLVETVRFNASDARVKVDLSNGDSLTGQLIPGQFEVVADWGKAKINSSALSQITRIKTNTGSSQPAPSSATREMVPAVRVEGTPVRGP